MWAKQEELLNKWWRFSIMLSIWKQIPIWSKCVGISSTIIQVFFWTVTHDEVHLQPLALECPLTFPELLPQSSIVSLIRTKSYAYNILIIIWTISHILRNHISHDHKNQRRQHRSLVHNNFHLKLLGQL